MPEGKGTDAVTLVNIIAQEIWGTQSPPRGDFGRYYYGIMSPKTPPASRWAYPSIQRTFMRGWGFPSVVESLLSKLKTGWFGEKNNQKQLKEKQEIFMRMYCVLDSISDALTHGNCKSLVPGAEEMPRDFRALLFQKTQVHFSKPHGSEAAVATIPGELIYSSDLCGSSHTQGTDTHGGKPSYKQNKTNMKKVLSPHHKWSCRH